MTTKTKKPAAKPAAKKPVAKHAKQAVVMPDSTPAVAAPKDQRNGITRPGAGTACRAIWDLLDQLKADGKELTFATLRAGIDPKVADATLRTQRQRWNHYMS
jgi:hypothetical protein